MNARLQNKMANAKTVAHVGTGRSPMSPTTSTKTVLRGKGTTYRSFPFSADAASLPSGAARRAQGHRSWAAARRAQGAAPISPHHRAAGRRAESREPCNWAAKPPSNKNTRPVGGSWTKKKLTPPQRECPRCQAIWDFEMVKRSFLVIFS